MRRLFSLASALVLAISTLPALAHAPASLRQTTPRGEKKQARADRKMDRAHTARRGESLSKEPRLVREEDKLDHRKHHPKK